jgi:hypothetical protein
MNTLAIALNGFAPGASPLQIATEGLLITIEPAQEQDALWIPLRSYGPPPTQKQNCTVHVTGCRATLTATSVNVAGHQPTMEEVDRLDDVAFEFLRRKEARTIAAKIEAEIQHLVWEHFHEREEQLQKIELERRHFNDGLQKFKADLTPSVDHENLANLLYSMTCRAGELRRKIRELEDEAEKHELRAQKSL